MNVKLTPRRCTTAAILAALLGPPFGCFASASHAAQLLTASADVTGKTPAPIPLSVPVAGSGHASTGRATITIAPLQVADLVAPSSPYAPVLVSGKPVAENVKMRARGTLFSGSWSTLARHAGRTASEPRVADLDLNLSVDLGGDLIKGVLLGALVARV